MQKVKNHNNLILNSQLIGVGIKNLKENESIK